MADLRFEQASLWAKSQLESNCDIRMLAGDASFRRYLRVIQGAKKFVLMDAPPEKEDVSLFLAVRDWLSCADVRVPDLISENRAQGFLLLEDFGDVTWALHIHSPAIHALPLDQLFEDARSQLSALQRSKPAMTLPPFDEARMRRECDLYLDWYLPKVAGYLPGQSERESFHAAMQPLLQELSALPQVPVHLDYHSRNLMLPDGQLPLGVIDFQDAVTGPVTYDLASLLYDCYQNYSEIVRREQSRLFFEQLPQPVRSEFSNFEVWHRAVRLTAMQRHIKAIGIFARLAYRDGKLQFLDEIPLARLHLQEEMQALDLDHPEFSLLKVESA